MRYILLFIIAFYFNACVSDLKPWEKNIHAKDTMKEGGLNALSKGFEEHIYFSKEATKTGNGISGGGCGCN